MDTCLELLMYDMIWHAFPPSGTEHDVKHQGYVNGSAADLDMKNVLYDLQEAKFWWEEKKGKPTSISMDPSHLSLPNMLVDYMNGVESVHA